LGGEKMGKVIRRERGGISNKAKEMLIKVLSLFSGGKRPVTWLIEN